MVRPKQRFERHLRVIWVNVMVDRGFSSIFRISGQEKLCLQVFSEARAPPVFT